MLSPSLTPVVEDVELDEGEAVDVSEGTGPVMVVGLDITVVMLPTVTVVTWPGLVVGTITVCPLAGVKFVPNVPAVES